MGFIYKIGNDFDEKIYIGKTSRDVAKRFQEHYIAGINNQNKSYINSDMAKKGIEHFYFDIIEECDNDLLNEREKYWINYYHSYINDPQCNGKGYNLTAGGDGRALPESQLNDIRKLWEQKMSVNEISEILNLPQSTIYHRICDYDDYDAEEYKHYISCKELLKPITQYTLDGIKIKDFRSISEASRELNIPRNQITNGLILNNAVHGFRFTYLGEKLEIKESKKKKVIQFDLDGNFIQIFDGAREAGRILNINSSGIIKTCNGKQSSSKGFIFIYDTDFSEELLQERVKEAATKKGYRKLEWK